MVVGGPPGGHSSSAEAATVQQILTEGERSLREEMADRKPLNPLLERLAKETEQTWAAAGRTAEAMGNADRAAQCYERALKHNPLCVEALTQVAGIYRRKEEFRRAAEYFSRLLSIQEGSGEVWGALGTLLRHLLRLDRALICRLRTLLPHARRPATGVHFVPAGALPLPSTQVGAEALVRYRYPLRPLRQLGARGRGLQQRHQDGPQCVDPFLPSICQQKVTDVSAEFEKANEIYFRLGIIYKQQRKHELSLDVGYHSVSFSSSHR